MPLSRRQKDVAVRLICALPLRARRQLFYLFWMRRVGHFRRPRTLAEKVNWRILNDRRPEIVWACDKLRVKEVAGRLGIATARVHWSGTDVAELVDAELPGEWVLKPNHRSRRLHFGSGAVTAGDVAYLREKTQGWLKDELGAGRGEWAYSRVQPKLFVEERLGDGKPLIDFRLYTYDGQVHYVEVVHDIFAMRAATPMRRFYTVNWEPLEVRQRREPAPVLPRPASFERMLEVAKIIGEPLDFARIDVYDVKGEVYLGEVTLYPNGGLGRFQPPEYNLEFARPWRLPKLDRHGQRME